jgi:hypothetical protein
MAAGGRFNGQIIRFEPGRFQRSLAAIKATDANLWKETRKSILKSGNKIKAAQKAGVM